MEGSSGSAAPARLRMAALRVAGFGALLAWTYVTFFSRLVHYSTRNDITHLNSTYAFACCGTICALLICALASGRRRAPGGLKRDDRGHRPSDVLALAAGGALTACTVVLAMVERGMFMQPWCSIVSTTAGVALAALYLVWADRLVRPGPVEVRQLALAFVAGALASALVLMLPEAWGLAACALLPPASAWCRTRVCLACARPDACMREPWTPAGHEGVERRVRPVFCRALATFSLLGVAESLSRALFLDVSPADASGTYRWVLLGSAALAALTVMLPRAARTGWARAAGVSRAVMLVMAFLFALAPIVQGWGLMSDLASATCYSLYNLLLWSMLTQMTAAYRMDPHVSFGLGLGAGLAGELAGTFAGSLLASFAELSWRGECLVALACSMAVLVSFLFVTDERRIAELLDADDERPRAPRRFRLRCEDVAHAYGLSAKETEVMVLAAKGRSAQRIQAELGISAGTVNTHLAHVYKKLDVHDRQQMIDMLEGRPAADETLRPSA